MSVLSHILLLRSFIYHDTFTSLEFWVKWEWQQSLLAIKRRILKRVWLPFWNSAFLWSQRQFYLFHLLAYEECKGRSCVAEHTVKKRIFRTLRFFPVFSDSENKRALCTTLSHCISCKLTNARTQAVIEVFSKTRNRRAKNNDKLRLIEMPTCTWKVEAFEPKMQHPSKHSNFRCVFLFKWALQLWKMAKTEHACRKFADSV